MNKQILNKVKEELLKNIKCQNCNSTYDSKNVKIKSLWWNKSFVTAYCEKCDLETQFEAWIMEESDVKKIQENKILEKEKIDWNKNFSNSEENLSESLIQEKEISEISKKMENFSSFKNLFSLVLVFSVFFTWCNSNLEETRQNILNWIETVKTTSSWFYNNWKEFYKNAQDVIKTAPEKISETKKNIEKMTEDAKKLKEDLQKKVEDTKKAVDQTKKAVDAASEALDAINSIWWTWIWENN